MSEQVVECKGSGVTSPFVNPTSGDIYYISSNTGEIYVIDGGKHSLVLTIASGSPSGAAFHPASNIMHIADIGTQAILRKDNDGDTTSVVVQVYEDHKFIGPSSIALDSESGNMFFTDAGYFGTTTIGNKTGSVYCITPAGPDGGQMLRPITFQSLAHPTGIATSPSTGCLFVAEMMENRVLRYFQRPAGIYNASVFYNFSGKVGPSCIVCDDESKRLYVGITDYDSEKAGVVHALSYDGELLQSFCINAGPEVSGLTLYNNNSVLVVSELTSNTLTYINI